MSTDRCPPFNKIAVYQLKYYDFKCHTTNEPMDIFEELNKEAN